jgi:hypothetical protein
MPAAAFGELANISSDKLLIQTQKTHGRSVRTKKINTTSIYQYPTRLHLLYIAMDSNARLTVRHLATDQVTTANIGTKEADLYREAKGNVENGTNMPNFRSRDFDTIIFDNPAFFTIVIDEVDWQLYFPAELRETEVLPNQIHDPVVFIDAKTVILAANPTGTSLTTTAQSFDENHAFHDATKTSINQRSAVRLINFFTDESGNLLQKWTDYGFEIYLRAPAGTGGHEHLTTIIIDPDGQNQGPPVGP